MNKANRERYLTGVNGPNNIGGVGINTFNDYSKNGYNNTDTIIGRNDYTTIPLIHNNLLSNSFNEQTIDHCLFIDSRFRNTGKSSNKNEPYFFEIDFGCDLPSSNVCSVEHDGEVYEYNRYVGKSTYQSVLMPYKYDNVECLTIDTLIMPIFLDYVTLEDGTIENTGQRLSRKERYLVLKIKELRSQRKVSNNPKIGEDAFIMKLDEDYCHFNEMYVPIHNKVSFFESNLKSLDKLTIEVCDKNGCRLESTLDGNYVNFNKLYHDAVKEMKELKKTGCTNEERLNCLENRLKSLRDIVECIDPQLHLTVYTIEPQLSTLVNHSRG